MRCAAMARFSDDDSYRRYVDLSAYRRRIADPRRAPRGVVDVPILLRKSLAILVNDDSVA
jgi:hypothetical protein